MSHASILNSGAYTSPRNGGTLATITAAAGQDNVEQNGPSIDRLGYGSATIAFATRSALTAAKTLTIAATLQDSADGSTWADAPAENQPGGVAGGGTVGTVTTTGDSHDCVQYDVNLRGLKQYIRVQYTADLSHSGTDTATVACLVILGGPTELPVT
jgi:hypothetical protein